MPDLATHVLYCVNIDILRRHVPDGAFDPAYAAFFHDGSR